MYKVLSEINVYHELSDDDIKSAVEKNEVTYPVMQAMGQSHREEYMKYILPFLDDDRFMVRRAAIQSILNINGEMALDTLKERERRYDISELDKACSDKILLIVAILHIEKSISELKKYFESEETPVCVKEIILTYYRTGYMYSESDIELIVYCLKAFADNNFEWIKKMKTTNRKARIISAVDSLGCSGSAENSVLAKISDQLSNELCELYEQILEKKLGNDLMFGMACTAQGMRKEYALRILKLIKNKVKGGSRKEFKKALKKWDISEEDL
ncbi:MAG: HEAT repeat domain-containing protein [Lachnospiraceae bacterium]